MSRMVKWSPPKRLSGGDHSEFIRSITMRVIEESVVTHPGLQFMRMKIMTIELPPYSEGNSIGVFMESYMGGGWFKNPMDDTRWFSDPLLALEYAHFELGVFHDTQTDSGGLARRIKFGWAVFRSFWRHSKLIRLQILMVLTMFLNIVAAVGSLNGWWGK